MHRPPLLMVAGFPVQGRKDFLKASGPLRRENLLTADGCKFGQLDRIRLADAARTREIEISLLRFGEVGILGRLLAG
jgi:hypothetical protein